MHQNTAQNQNPYTNPTICLAAMKGSSESAAQSGASRDLTKSEIEDLREAFNIFDINQDGEWEKFEWNDDE